VSHTCSDMLGRLLRCYLATTAETQPPLGNRVQQPVWKLLLQVGGVLGPLLYCSASHLCQHHSVYLHVQAVYQHTDQMMYTTQPRQDRANTDCAACWTPLHFVCHADAPECAQSPPCSQSAADQARYLALLVLNRQQQLSNKLLCYLLLPS
jgi:hypothetical protein